MLILTPDEWDKILNRLKKDYADRPSVYLIRDSMKRELGFTTRYHSDYAINNYGKRVWAEMVHLDFFDPMMESFFVLKYMNHD